MVAMVAMTAMALLVVREGEELQRWSHHLSLGLSSKRPRHLPPVAASAVLTTPLGSLA